MAIDKEAIRGAVLAALEERLVTLRASAKATRDGATHEESRAENDKDTRGLEASYLARGQAQRVEEVEEALRRFRFLELPSFERSAIGVGAWVRVEIDGEPKCFLMSAAAGGVSVQVDGESVHVLSPATPLGRALLERVEGDDLELKLGPRVREVVVIDVR